MTASEHTFASRVALTLMLAIASVSCALERLEVGPTDGGPGNDAARDGGQCAEVGCFLYVTSSVTSRVYVIDTTTAQVEAEIGTAPSPRAVAFHPAGKKAYVASYASDQVQVLDTASRTITGAVAVGERPVALATTPDGSRLFVANAGDGSVSVVDTATDVVTGSLPLAGKPRSLAVSPDGKELWVGDGCGETCVRALALSSPTSWTDLPAVGGGALAFTPDGNFAYAAEPVGCGGRYQKVAPANHELLASLLADGKGAAWSVAVSHDGKRAVFGKGSCSASYNVYLGTTADDGLLATLTAPTDARAVALSPDDSTLFVARLDGTSGYVTFFDLATLAITHNVPVGGGDVALAVSP